MDFVVNLLFRLFLFFFVSERIQIVRINFFVGFANVFLVNMMLVFLVAIRFTDFWNNSIVASRFVSFLSNNFLWAGFVRFFFDLC